MSEMPRCGTESRSRSLPVVLDCSTSATSAESSGASANVITLVGPSASTRQKIRSGARVADAVAADDADAVAADADDEDEAAAVAAVAAAVPSCPSFCSLAPSSTATATTPLSSSMPGYSSLTGTAKDVCSPMRVRLSSISGPLASWGSESCSSGGSDGASRT